MHQHMKSSLHSPRMSKTSTQAASSIGSSTYIWASLSSPCKAVACFLAFPKMLSCKLRDSWDVEEREATIRREPPHCFEFPISHPNARAFAIPRLLLMNNSCIDCGKEQMSGSTMGQDLPRTPHASMYPALNEILFNEINIRVDGSASVYLWHNHQAAPLISMPATSMGESAVSGHEIHEACCSRFH